MKTFSAKENFWQTLANTLQTLMSNIYKHLANSKVIKLKQY